MTAAAAPPAGAGAAQAADPPLRVAVVGAGPRGLSVCERLVALHAAQGRARELRIDLIDPYPPGPGRVWRTDQSPELLMNTTIADQTVFPDASTGLEPCDTGPSMPEWYRARGGTAQPESAFAPRALYGEYLAWSFERVHTAADEGTEIVVHPATATAIVEPGQHEEPAAKQLVRLDDGTTLEADAVVLCLGHLPARLQGERANLARFARASGLTYLPPGLPAETEVERLLAGQTVVFRGFGLNYFDLQALLTTGRGGRFSESPDGTLRYAPSGAEPILAPSSRRGVPYRCKPITPGRPARDWQLRYFTPGSVSALEDAAGGLLFNDQLWPLILAELRRAWYTALAASRPEAFAAAPAELFAALDASVAEHVSRRSADTVRPGEHRPGLLIAGGPDWAALEARLLADTAQALDLAALLHPLEGREFSAREPGPGSFHDWMLAFLDAEYADALAGPERAPSKAVFSALWAARGYLKELVADGRIDPLSFATEIRGWFEGFASGLCDGPPPSRFAQLAALARAGLVTFIGPEVRIAQSRPDRPAAFVATSPAVPGEVRARALVDAASPANNVRAADDALLAGMLDRGQVCAATLEGPDGIELPLSGLLVDGEAFNTVDPRGHVHPRRFVLSIQLSADQLGLAIAANPQRRARTLIDAHRIAQAILDLPS
ncbi:FAD/NAD(P)-binding protein [Brevibacterium sp. BRM-1]|uniref:FAD/NAD(P)-binding protein n=1 Tax=Brevibacterium sp. BRM-1 TaxID=2999062 RepID=UPI0022823A88|nr:FAD/NAD(P)-binding protein [Brevibacterium sp. BRM-1]WAL39248.1 FAD/NAD(P)-binding protein [Brevibacterium sp. BRM-1]